MLIITQYRKYNKGKSKNICQTKGHNFQKYNLNHEDTSKIKYLDVKIKKISTQ